jgi:hypothetical protein
LKKNAVRSEMPLSFLHDGLKTIAQAMGLPWQRKTLPEGRVGKRKA